MALNKRKMMHLVNSIFLMFYFSMLKGEIIVQGKYIDSVTGSHHHQGNIGINEYFHTTDDRNPVHGYINQY